MADKGIQANVTAAGSADYYVTGKVRPTGTSCRVQINDTASGEDDITGLTSGVWQDFTSATFSAQTASNVAIGWSNNSGFLAVACDWSDVRLINASTGATVSRWQLNESADGDLNGYPALDSVGGYHGTHTNCSGGTGETTILQTAGMDWNKYRHFNGAEKVTAAGQPIADVGAIEVSFVFTNTEGVVFFSQQNGGTLYGLSITQARTSGNVHATFHQGSNVFTNISQSGFIAGDIITIRVNYNFTTSTFSININGLTGDGSLTGRHSASIGTNLFQLGANGNDTFFYDSIVWNLVEYDTDQTTPILQWRGYGDEPWVDIVGSTNGTESGTFSNFLIPESDTTAGQDALGNSIAEPRPTAATFNLFGDGEYASIADADSLDVTTEATWEVWGNFYGDRGVSETLLSKDISGTSNRLWNINKVSGDSDNQLNVNIVNSANNLVVAYSQVGLSDAIQHIVYTYNAGTLKCYVNGVEVTLHKFFGTTPATSLPNLSYPVLIGAFNATPTNFAKRQLSRPKIYNRALSADEVLKNFNAQKSSFGL